MKPVGTDSSTGSDGQVGTAATARSVSLRDGQTANSIDITMVRGSAIAGTIVDEFGEPVQGVELSALQVQVIAGRRRALRVSTLGTYKTDDRGQYRLFGLTPGTSSCGRKCGTPRRAMAVMRRCIFRAR